MKIQEYDSGWDKEQLDFLDRYAIPHLGWLSEVWMNIPVFAVSDDTIDKLYPRHKVQVRRKTSRETPKDFAQQIRLVLENKSREENRNNLFTDTDNMFEIYRPPAPVGLYVKGNDIMEQFGREPVILIAVNRLKHLANFARSLEMPNIPILDQNTGQNLHTTAKMRDLQNKLPSANVPAVGPPSVGGMLLAGPAIMGAGNVQIVFGRKIWIRDTDLDKAYTLVLRHELTHAYMDSKSAKKPCEIAIEESIADFVAATPFISAGTKPDIWKLRPEPYCYAMLWHIAMPSQKALATLPRRIADDWKNFKAGKPGKFISSSQWRKICWILIQTPSCRDA